MDPKTAVAFRKLDVGTVFDFDRSTLTPGHVLAAGPWRKIARRSYRHAVSGMTCTVGTTGVLVIPVREVCTWCGARTVDHTAGEIATCRGMDGL